MSTLQDDANRVRLLVKEQKALANYQRAMAAVLRRAGRESDAQRAEHHAQYIEQLLEFLDPGVLYSDFQDLEQL